MKKIPKQERARETASDLLTATVQFLRRNHYSKLSTNKIAELAGVSIGTLYQYFPSNEALVVALVRQQFEADFRLVQGIIEESESLSLRRVCRT
ncbi:MAG: TetR/AcrR family transcriptional regulator [Chitinophagaceae bacterium]|nr:TetR/AcrR family transcriptional regulator [Oligoflexus sp.]